MSSIIKIKRGLKANLPTLELGELALCTDTKEIYIGAVSGNVLLTPEDDASPDSYFNTQDDGEYTQIVGFTAEGLEATDIVIPAIINGKPVECTSYGAGNNAYSMFKVDPTDSNSPVNPNIVNVKFQEGVVFKNNSAQQLFQNATNLQRIEGLPMSVNEMDNFASSCSNLVEVDRLPKFIANARYIFESCSNLETIPTVNIIGQANYAFRNSGIKALKLGIVPNVLSYAFENMSNLIHVDMPKVRNLYSAPIFKDCNSLEVAPDIIGEGVVSINDMFKDCTNLKRVPIIPKSVRQASNAFRNCANIKGDVWVLGTDVSMANAFTGIEGGLRVNIHYPAGTNTASSIEGHVVNGSMNVYLKPFNAYWNA